VQVASAADSSSPLKPLVTAASSIPDLPFAIKDSLATLATRVAEAASLSPPADALSSVRASAIAAWAALQTTFSLPQLSSSLPSISLPASPSLPDLSSISSSITSYASMSPLLNGTYSEVEVMAIVAAVAVVCTLVTVTARPPKRSSTASDAELPAEYDSDAIYRYWSSRPVTLLSRSIETASLAAGFIVGLQLDRLTGTVFNSYLVHLVRLVLQLVWKASFLNVSGAGTTL
jgi:hypothetical protein